MEIAPTCDATSKRSCTSINVTRQTKSAGLPVCRYTLVTRATQLQLFLNLSENILRFCKRPVIPLIIDYFVKSLHVHVT